MLKEAVLAVIVSIDTFLASVAYRSGNISIPPVSAVVINGLSAMFLGISLLVSELISHIFSPQICGIAGFMILTAIGISTIFKSLIRNLVRRLSKSGELLLKPGSSGIIVKLYLDDTLADIDNSKTLSPKEAIALALAGSLDSISTGLGAGCGETNPLTASIFTFIAGTLAITAGTLAGRRIAQTERDLSWLGGVALVIFAVLEFI